MRVLRGSQFGFGKICTECAGPMDGTKDVTLVNEDPAPASDTPKPETQKKSPIKWIVGILALLVVIIVIFSIEEEKGVTVVTGHSWSRSIEVEQYKQVTEKDWEDRVPIERQNSVLP